LISRWVRRQIKDVLIKIVSPVKFCFYNGWNTIYSIWSYLVILSEEAPIYNTWFPTNVTISPVYTLHLLIHSCNLIMTSLRGKQRKERNINKQLYVDKQKLPRKTGISVSSWHHFWDKWKENCHARLMVDRVSMRRSNDCWN